jgi:hypothetical protein
MPKVARRRHYRNAVTVRDMRFRLFAKGVVMPHAKNMLRLWYRHIQIADYKTKKALQKMCQTTHQTARQKFSKKHPGYEEEAMAATVTCGLFITTSLYYLIRTADDLLHPFNGRNGAIDENNATLALWIFVGYLQLFFLTEKFRLREIKEEQRQESWALAEMME